MPVEVRVSEWVVDRGIGWSCGQCPLDAHGRVTAPGDVEAQARLVAGRIIEGLSRAGLPAEGLLALIVYGVEPERSAAILGACLPPGLSGLPIVPVGVPPLYYQGMTLEVDVIASELPARRSEGADFVAASASWLTAIAWRGAPARAGGLPALAEIARLAGRSEGEVVSSMLALPQDWPVPDGWSAASVRTALPGAAAAALLLLADGPVTTTGAPAGDVRLEVADARHLLRLTAWSTNGPMEKHVAGRRIGPALGAQADAAMAAITGALAARGLGPEALIKVTAHHIGGGAEALHASLAARHRYHGQPAPASTGLGLAGLGPEGALVIIEALAARPA